MHEGTKASGAPQASNMTASVGDAGFATVVCDSITQSSRVSAVSASAVPERALDDTIVDTKRTDVTDQIITA